MNSKDVREKYIKFFVGKNHVEIPPAPLVLDNDPTTLFTSSGMQPLVPFLMGEKHPSGKRLVDSQPSIRTQDIEEVGDNRHTTFFEMLGNWSLGDYFKDEQLAWFYEFLIKELELPRDKLWVSVFEGNKGVPKDIDSIEIWKKIGISESHIRQYGDKKNWWSRSGTPEQMPIGEIGGPDSEMFYDFGEERKLHENSPFKNEVCHPNCDCGRFLEIGNSVFIQYRKVAGGKLEELPQKNVDFGGGLERLVAATNNDPDVFNIDLLKPIIEVLEKELNKSYGDDDSFTKSARIMSDHIRASVFLIKDGVTPSNKLQGYILRRLLRRATTKAFMIDRSFDSKDFRTLTKLVIDQYPALFDRSAETKIADVVSDEVRKFRTTIESGFKRIEKIEKIDGTTAFDLYQTFGFPLEITTEIFNEKGQEINLEEFEKEFEKHKDASRSASVGVFKGGLADSSEDTTKLHTATHLLQWALREVIGDGVKQKGSKVTADKLRFDFPSNDKLSDETIEEVERLMNEKIDLNLTVGKVEMSQKEAEEIGALRVEGRIYPDKVSVYFIGENLDTAFSKEFCGGPHVSSTSEIGRVKIDKQEKIGTGVLRIYASIDDGSN